MRTRHRTCTPVAVISPAHMTIGAGCIHIHPNSGDPLSDRISQATLIDEPNAPQRGERRYPTLHATKVTSPQNGSALTTGTNKEPTASFGKQPSLTPQPASPAFGTKPRLSTSSSTKCSIL